MLIFAAAYIILFVAATISARNFTKLVVDSFSSNIENTENFYMSDDKFYYDGDSFEGYINGLGITLVICTKGNVSINEDKPTILVSSNSAVYSYKDFSFGIDFASLKESAGDIDFSKSDITNDFEAVKNMVLNILVSASVVIFVLLIPILLLLMLLLALLAYGLFKYFKITVNFTQTLFIAIGSMIYPAIAAAIIFAVPNGFQFFVIKFDTVVRFQIVLILTYLLIAVLSFRTTAKTQSDSQQK